MLNNLFKRIAILFLLAGLTAGTSFAQSSFFTYQGRLTDGGNPADGGYDMQFKLFDVNGIQQGSTISISSVQVTNGVFKVDLDFGSATFDGSRRFLEIGVRPESSSDPHTVLSPRQLVTAVPYSIRSIVAGAADTANIANTATNATNAAQLGGLAASQYVLTTDSRLSNARTPTAGSNNYVQNQGALQQTPANFNISGSGTLGGTLTANTVTANTINGNGAGLTSLDASNIATGTLDSARLGVIPVNKGGTGLINPGGAGNYLRSNGAGGWTNSLIQPSDVPDGSSFYIQSQTVPQAGASFNIAGSGTIGGTLTAGTVSGGTLSSTGAVNAATQYNLGGSRILDNNGSFNLFVGLNAGPGMTGGGNTIIGFDAGLSASTGDSNTIVGAFAGQKNTANNNTFIGTSAGLENTSGADNVFIGVNAGDTNLSGSENTFVGRNAGQANTAGGNTFFGARAGVFNASGAANAFFGTRAGDDNQTGNFNSFFGFGAGTLNSSGSNNVFMGYLTGSVNTTGSNITLIGTGADVEANNLSYATAIGAGAVVDTSNTIVIGRSNPADLVIIPGSLNVASGTGALGGLVVTGFVDYNPVAGGLTSVCATGEFKLAFCSSSLRYKTDIRHFAGGLDIVRRLRPITFNWREGSQPRDVGFGAEEVAKIDPLFVTYNDKGEIEGVKYAQISTVLVNAVQQQQRLIEQQRSLIERQQRQLDSLKKLVCRGRSNAAACK
jgi:hypothetical protein